MIIEMNIRRVIILLASIALVYGLSVPRVTETENRMKIICSAAGGTWDNDRIGPFDFVEGECVNNASS